MQVQNEFIDMNIANIGYITNKQLRSKLNLLWYFLDKKILKWMWKRIKKRKRQSSKYNIIYSEKTIK